MFLIIIHHLLVTAVIELVDLSDCIFGDNLVC